MKEYTKEQLTDSFIMGLVMSSKEVTAYCRQYSYQSHYTPRVGNFVMKDGVFYFDSGERYDMEDVYKVEME